MQKIVSLLVVSLVCMSGLFASAAFADVSAPVPAPSVVMPDPLPVDLTSAGSLAPRTQIAAPIVIVAAAPREKHMVCRGPWIESQAGGGYRRCEIE